MKVQVAKHKNFKQHICMPTLKRIEGLGSVGPDETQFNFGSLLTILGLEIRQIN